MVKKWEHPLIAYLQSLHELPGSGPGNGSKVIDEVSFSHSDAGVMNGDGVVVFVGDDSDLQFLLCIQHRGISQTLVPDLVQGLDKWKREKINVLIHLCFQLLTSEEFEINSLRNISLFEQNVLIIKLIS